MTKVLLVDDNESITKMMSKFLTLKGHDVTVSNSGKNGLNMIMEQKFDIVLLDLSMPEFGGRDVINALVEADKMKENKIVLFTASVAADKEIQELIDKGVSSCLRKPVELGVLIKTVEGAAS